MKNRALAVVALVSLFSSATALAQPPPPPAAPAASAGEADAHFRRGAELYKEADFNAAPIEFRRANDIAPDDQVLYNNGQTYDSLQDYANALKYLEKYLKAGGAQISPGRREGVQGAVNRLRSRVASIDVTTNVPDVDISIDDVPVGK